MLSCLDGSSAWWWCAARPGSAPASPASASRRPPVEAFFTTDLTLSLDAILAQYRERWAVEITLRDSNAFTGFGQDQCRKYTRVVGANTLRLVLAAARTLWFVEQAHRLDTLALTRYRPWYRHKRAPSQLDIVWDVPRSLAGPPEFFPYHGSLRVLPKFRRSPKILCL